MANEPQKQKPFSSQVLTKREEFAKTAMAGILTHEAGIVFQHETQCPTIARKAVCMADALLAELEKTPTSI